MTFAFRTAAAAVALAVAMSGAADAQQTLRLNHNNPADHPTGMSLEFFADRVGEMTDGALRIRVFHNAQLGSQRESTELVQQGALEMARSNAAELEAFEPLYGVLNLPFLFASQDHNWDVLTGDVGRTILQASRDRGFIGLGFLVEGARSFYTVEPAASLEDLQGKRIRVQPSPSAIRMVELLGASPTPIDWGELYSALQQGVVDGAENNPTALTSVRHGEVATHFMFNEHTMIPAVVFMSTAVYDRLSAEQQEAIHAAAREMEEFHRSIWNDIEAAALEQAAEEMGVTFTEVDKEPFMEAVRPMIEEAAALSEVHADLIARIQAMVD